MNSSKAISPGREIAFRVLKRVHGGGFASDVLRKESASADSRDASLAETIVFGCLRYQRQLDFLIEHYSGRPGIKLDEEVRFALRMGIYQLRYLQRIPAHAAVTESVDLVKRAHKSSAAGLVNAVLRKVNRKLVPWPNRATELSMPDWILERWDRNYGIETATLIAQAALEEPEDAVNPVTGRQQDPGSQAIVPLLDVRPGMTVLDLCAAPGNKTAQILAVTGNVVACDRKLIRLAEVPSQAARVLLDGVASPLPFRAQFDRILVDAPCSGTGTLSRNPEIKWRMTPEDLLRFPPLQKALLEHAFAVLKPGGRLVYSTCSLEPEENEAVAQGFPVSKLQVRIPSRDRGDGFGMAVIMRP